MTLIDLLPFENFTFESSLSQKEVYEELQKEVDTGDMESFIQGQSVRKPYEGTLSLDSFEIKRIIKYRNGFLPNIQAAVSKQNNGTRIIVKMRTGTINLIVICCVIAYFIFRLVKSIFIKFYDANSTIVEKSEVEPIIPLVFVVACYLMIIGGFKFESKKSKEFLLRKPLSLAQLKKENSLR